MALSPSLGIPEHYYRSFEKNWGHSIQQEEAILKDTVMVKSFEGKEKVFTDLDQVTFEERLGRLNDSNPQEVTAKKRKMGLVDFRCQVIFDRRDSTFLGMLATPNSEIIQEMKFAWRRVVDQKIIAAASNTVYGGESPYVTAIDLPSTQQVAANFGGTTVGLTAEKLIEARRIFKSNDLQDLNDLYLVISPDDEVAITTSIKAAGNDVWASKLAKYEEGGQLFGFNVKISNNLTTVTSTDVSTALAYSKSKGVCVTPDSMTVEIDKLPTRDHAVQIAAYADYGFTRRYEKGVVEIFCDQSP